VKLSAIEKDKPKKGMSEMRFQYPEVYGKIVVSEWMVDRRKSNWL
jgi:hypothetical protein